MNSRAPHFSMSTLGWCTVLLVLGTIFGSSALHAQNKNPDIILDSPCPPQPPSTPLTYSVKKGDPAVSTEISVRKNDTDPFTDKVIWLLASQGGCSGDEHIIHCGQNLFTVEASDVPVFPTGSAGRVRISTPGAITMNDLDKKGTFSVTVTKDPAGATDPQCTWNYQLQVTSGGGGWGDPHLTTVDGVAYDFQSAGEFTALREDQFEVQTRQTPVPTTYLPGANDYTGLRSCVSIYTAVAARIGKNRVTLQPDASGEPSADRGLQLRVNGKLVTLPENGIDLPGDQAGTLAGRIVRVGAAYQITDARGTQLVVTPAFWDAQKRWYLNVNVYQTAATAGVMGRLAEGSWLPALPDGTSLGSMPESLNERYQQLYEKFADAWRVTDATSLFDYASGTNTATFTLDEWPRLLLDPESSSCALAGQTSVMPATPEVAAEACKGVTDAAQRANCVFDVTVTGHTGFAKTYGTMQEFEPHGTGWQPVLAGAGQPTPTPPPPTSHWPWWWILILILVLIVIIVLFLKK